MLTRPQNGGRGKTIPVLEGFLNSALKAAVPRLERHRLLVSETEECQAELRARARKQPGKRMLGDKLYVSARFPSSMQIKPSAEESFGPPFCLIGIHRTPSKMPALHS